MLEVEVDQAGRSLSAEPLLSKSIAVCTAKVVTPAPPTAGKNVKIWAAAVSAAVADFNEPRASAQQLDRRHRLDQ